MDKKQDTEMAFSMVLFFCTHTHHMYVCTGKKRLEETMSLMLTVFISGL